MLAGEVIYRDFFQFTLPGTELVYLALFHMFGPRVWIPNAMLVLLGLGLAWLGVFISKRVIRGRSAYLPSLIFLTFAFRGWLDASHHWYSTLAVMAAVAVVLEERTPTRLASAAALCALAAFFTQSQGLAAVMGLGLFLFWENRRKRRGWHALLTEEARLFAICFFTLLALDAYFVWKAGLRRFLYCTVTFLLRYYSAFPEGSTWRVYMIGLPAVPPWTQAWKVAVFLFVHLLIPLAYILFFLRYQRHARGQPDEPWDRLMVVNLMGLFLFLSIAPAPAWNRLYSISLPAFVVLIWLLGSEGKWGERFVMFLWIAALTLGIAEPWSRQKHWRAYLDLPPGRTAFHDPDMYDKYRWVFHRTQSSEFFFGGFYPDFYFLLGLRDPAQVPYVTPFDYTRPEQVQDVVDSLERHRVRLVLWAVDLDIPDERHPEGDHLAPLRAYLRQHYSVVKMFPNFEVWERKRTLAMGRHTTQGRLASSKGS